MRLYSVYFNPASKDNQVIIVPEGNSFVAGLLSLFWAAYKRLWPAFYSAALIGIIATLATNAGYELIGHFLRLALIGLFFFCAYDIECYCLEKKGYKLKEVLFADNADEAELRFYQAEQNNENAYVR